MTDHGGLTRLLLAAGSGIVVGAVAVPAIIAWQRRAALGQHVYEDGPGAHAAKEGTPTMGGVAFALAAVAGAAFAAFSRPTLLLCALVVGAALIGLADDMLALRRQRALGLRARAKFGWLLGLAMLYAVEVSLSQPDHLTQLWFGGSVRLPEWAWFALTVAAIVGAANAVNLTDGLDGLAVGTTLAPLLLIVMLVGDSVGAAAFGACLAFAWFNLHPARAFMGDTGSLALGALLAGLAVQHGLLLLLPFAGAVFVVEALSVMAQVASFKLTGRRIFKMSPLHHHFELSGWPERRVTGAFVAASVIAAALFAAAMLLSQGASA